MSEIVIQDEITETTLSMMTFSITIKISSFSNLIFRFRLSMVKPREWLFWKKKFLSKGLSYVMIWYENVVWQNDLTLSTYHWQLMMILVKTLSITIKIHSSQHKRHSAHYNRCWVFLCWAAFLYRHDERHLMCCYAGWCKAVSLYWVMLCCVS